MTRNSRPYVWATLILVLLASAFSAPAAEWPELNLGTTHIIPAGQYPGLTIDETSVTLILSPGTVLPWLVISAPGVTVQGGEVRGNPGSNRDLVSVGGTSWAKVAGVTDTTIHNMYIHFAEPPRDNRSDCIYLNHVGTLRTEITGCTVENSGRCLIWMRRAHDVLIANNIFRNNALFSEQHSEPISAGGCWNVRVIGCTFDNFRGTGAIVSVQLWNAYWLIKRCLFKNGHGIDGGVIGDTKRGGWTGLQLIENGVEECTGANVGFAISNHDGSNTGYGNTWGPGQRFNNYGWTEIDPPAPEPLTNEERLDDHETRITALEGAGR